MTSHKEAYKNINDYGLIGDRHSAALVGIDGSIDWCTFPRFDSPSVFASILDAKKGGRFAITPIDIYTGGQRYLPDTNVLETTFVTQTGTCTLTDFMPFYRHADNSPIAPGCLVRIVRCEEGTISLNIVYEPRPDYARASGTIETRGADLVVSIDESELTLRSPVPLNVERDTATAIITLSAGEEVVFVLRYGNALNLWSDEAASPRQLLDRTVEYWLRKAESLDYQGEWRDEVVRSYLALHLLTYVPTGAIVAAPTTSLPEWVGGKRNWDYRYTWLRDSAFTIEALSKLGHHDEAVEFFKWLQDVCGINPEGAKHLSSEEHIHILYRVDGETNATEETLSHLEGYRGSQPVRIGNGAVDQLQHDVYGELLASAHLLASQGDVMMDGYWDIIRVLANLAAEEWLQPDSGIWEVRGGPFHFLYSDAMCWVALDRAVSLAEMMGQTGPEIEKWQRVAEEIKRSVLEKGWNEEKQAFVQHYDSDALDASFLLLPLVGFLPIDDPRVVSTVERIQEELVDGPFVSRYRPEETDDGVFGEEGAFILCSFWLAQVLARMGRTTEARSLFIDLLGYANHLGLFAEMVDPRTGVALGNFPQAFTHIGLILAARECSVLSDSQAEQISQTP